MSLATDIAGDYAVVDNTTTVSFTAQNPAAAAVTGIVALKRAPQKRDLDYAANIGFTSDMVVWHLWNTSINPQQGDKITDAGSVVWNVQSASQDTLASRWRCVCTKAP